MMDLHGCISFLNSCVGFCFAIRILHQCDQKKLIQLSGMTKIGTALVFITLGGVTAYFRQPMLTWSVMIVFTLCYLLLPLGLCQLRERQFRSAFPDFLNQLIIHVRLGHSLRSASEIALRSGPRHFSHHMGKVLDHVAFLQQKPSGLSSFARELMGEFHEMHLHPHQTLQRLINLRRRLRVESDFRHKSGQVSLQIRVQAAILSGIYIAVLIFSGVSFGVRKHYELMSLSFILFVMGVLTMFVVCRKGKWKV